jgi:hypothetical protein
LLAGAPGASELTTGSLGVSRAPALLRLPQGCAACRLRKQATVGGQARASPLNPIEKAYSKLKVFLRKIAERNGAGLLRALDACADIFKPAGMRNYFEACGYDTD